MANTVTISPQHKITQHHRVQFLFVSIVTTETYATATGGFSVDFGDLLDAYNIRFDDVMRIVGRTANGHLATFTKTATDGTFTVKLWDDASTEIADGALTETLQAEIMCSVGAGI